MIPIEEITCLLFPYIVIVCVLMSETLLEQLWNVQKTAKVLLQFNANRLLLVTLVIIICCNNFML